MPDLTPLALLPQPKTLLMLPQPVNPFVSLRWDDQPEASDDGCPLSFLEDLLGDC